MSSPLLNYLALDIGSVRIGLATANSIARIASPLKYIANDQQVMQTIVASLQDNQTNVLVVGLPQNIEGQDTKQTEYIRQFVGDLKNQLKAGKLSDIKIVFVDESSTSQLAERQLDKSKKAYQKGDIDALSASYILQRYLDDESSGTSSH